MPLVLGRCVERALAAWIASKALMWNAALHSAGKSLAPPLAASSHSTSALPPLRLLERWHRQEEV